jgi:hypothetical protein
MFVVEPENAHELAHQLGVWSFSAMFAEELLRTGDSVEGTSLTCSDGVSDKFVGKSKNAHKGAVTFDGSSDGESDRLSEEMLHGISEIPVPLHVRDAHSSTSCCI